MANAHDENTWPNVGPDADTITVSFAALVRLRNDAWRYRWLKQFARSTSLTMDGNANWHIGAEAIRERGQTLDSAIDNTIMDS
jgi:hypothetical protein